MSYSVAIVKEQGQEFVVLSVKDSVISSPTKRDEMIAFGETEFGRRTMLLGQRNHQTYGPPDIVRWMRDVHPSQLPWRDFTLR